MKKFFKSFVAVLLVCLMAVTMTSCVPKDPAKAKANLKENGYVISDTASKAGVVAFVTTKYGSSMRSEVGEVVYATNGEESVLIVYSANRDLLDKLEADLEALYKHVNSKASDEVDLKTGKSRKCVWVGTKAGVKAAG